MDIDYGQKIWQENYKIVPEQLRKVKQTGKVFCAFNTNIDAVIKITGQRLREIAELVNLSEADLEEENLKINSPKDVVRGIIKCFSQGIAEEWLCEKQAVYEWMRDNLGYDRLQMGGQAGIVANAIATLGVSQVFVHTNSHPKLQAKQFLNLPNLLGFDEHNEVKQASKINRVNDLPLIHWIIEFDKDDVLEFADKKYICPKANRFIATYDMANMNLQINEGFIDYLQKNKFESLILSGYHSLAAENSGVERLEATLPLIRQWKADNPQGIIHLELASTQDKEIRKVIIEEIAPLVDSVGLNDREALDVLEIISPDMYDTIKQQKIDAVKILEILNVLKLKFKTPRIQLHMFGLYITLQDKNFRVNPEQNRNGMMLASVVAATKAGVGKIDSYDNLLWSYGKEIGAYGIEELSKLADSIETDSLSENGLAEFNGFDLIAVPTILIEKPVTLVGMGDTISSVSLIGAK